MRYLRNAFLISLIILSSAYGHAERKGANHFPIPKPAPGGKWGYVNESGQFILRPVFEEAYHYSEDLARVCMMRKYGFIDRQGNPAIYPQYSDARDFHEGLAAVMIIDMNNKAKWGYINRQGRFEISPRFDTAGDFANGTAVVNRDGKSMYIDREGNSMAE